MDAGDGVFVSNDSTEDWTEDPDLPGTEMHVLVRQDGRLRRADASSHQRRSATLDARPAEDGSCDRGSVRIEFENLPPVELGPGGIASFPAGLAMTWFVTTPYKELWVFA